MAILNNIFITGVTHGIGKATAELFCENGWNVYGCASNDTDTRGYEMMKKYPNFHFYLADVSKEEDLKKVFKELPQLGVCFNNAGIGCVPHTIDEMVYQDALDILKVNLIGVGLCMKYEIPKEAQLIINNASISAFRTQTGCDPFYSASKAGVIALTKECAAKNKFKHIKFLTISPGYVKTRMTAEDSNNTDIKWIEPIVVAQTILDLVQGRKTIETGGDITITGEN